MRLEPQQAAVLVNARHVLLRRMVEVRSARAQIVLALGAAAVKPDAVCALSPCPAVPRCLCPVVCPGPAAPAQ